MPATSVLSQPVPHRSHVMERRGSLLIGCLAVLVLVLGVMAAGGIYLYLNGRSLVADAARNAVVSVIDDSELPDDQKVRIVAEVDSVTSEFVAGNISLEDLQFILKELSESPLLPLGAVYAIDERYIQPSTLSDEEKLDGQLALNRFAQGVLAEKLGERDIEDVTAPLDDNPVPNHWSLKDPDQVTDDDLRELIATAKAKADEAGIGMELLQIDIAQEVSDAIARALGRANAETASNDEASTTDEPEVESETGEETQPAAEEPAEDGAADGGD